ncbi:unnamed protein product, partial [Rotaria magnacalcarata]
MEHATTYQRQSNEQARQSFITAETAKEVAKVIREKKYFVDPEDVKEKLEKARYDIE